jgi:DNA-binding XRE family transcriptional regulator
MNKNIKKLAITLEEFAKDFTKEDLVIVEREKRYYYLVSALRKMRNSLGLTQEKLSQMSKIPRTTITKIESGSRNVTLETLMTMAESMGKTIELKLA